MKHSKADVARMENALKQIATWSQELQDQMGKMEDGYLIQWRGCVGWANYALRKEGV